MSSAPLLGVYGFSFSYGKSRVLDEFSFEVESGKIVALLGPNGSGKSTLMKAIAGILPFESREASGQIRFRGQDLLNMDTASRARAVAYVGADLRADFPMTAHEAVLMGRICHGSGALRQFSAQDHEKTEWAMHEALCWTLRDRDLATLSGGERQLVAVARALAQGARLLFLDEALSRMDLNHVALIGKMLRRRLSEGFSTLLVSHDLNIASALADECILLKKGKRIATGKTKEVLTSEKIAELYPGADLKVSANPVSGAPMVFFTS